MRTIPTVTGFVTEFVGRHEENGEELTDRKILLCEVREWPRRRADRLLQRRLERRAARPSRGRSSAHPSLRAAMITSTARERLFAGLPSTRMLDVAGVSTAVLEAGEGPNLVLLHGGIECGGAMWTPVIRAPGSQPSSDRPGRPRTG